MSPYDFISLCLVLLDRVLKHKYTFGIKLLGLYLRFPPLNGYECTYLCLYTHNVFEVARIAKGREIPEMQL